MSNPNTGRFAWREIMSTDVTRAVRFYQDLLGWTVQEMPMGEMGTYRIFSSNGQQVAGAMSAPPNVPSHWLVYVGVDDADAAAKKAQELGAKILVPPTTVPNMLRFAVAMDREGAAFGVLQPMGPDANRPLAEGTPPIGAFSWEELYVKDQDAAGKFYGALFGWTGKVAPGDPMKYWHWMNKGKDIGGMMTLPHPDVPPHWLSYVAISDCDASTKKAKELGAKVLVEPMDIPRVGKFSVVQDPTGAAFALFRSAHV